MAQLIGSRYSNALFQIAIEENILDTLINDANIICTSLKENPDFNKVIEHPRVSSTEKFEIFKNTFQESVSKELIGLINVMITKNREHYILEVLEGFLLKSNVYKGITTAHISSATPLTESNVNDIKTNLSKNLNKEIEVHLTVDKSLIGGVSIKVDGLLIDRTIKKQLADIKKELLSIQLA
jgi:F-type H+-transporting ATPase subunit delta